MPAVPAAAVAAAAVMAPVSAASEAHCKSVADQRERDAEANGYDSDLQQQVYAGTYKTCMDWEGTHR